MNYKIIAINTLDKTMVIQWEDGVTLNYDIPVELLYTQLNPITIEEQDALIKGLI